MGVCGGLIPKPQARVTEMTLQYYEALPLHVATEARVAEILDAGNHDAGVHIDEVSRQTGIKAQKLARILRTLCTSHVLQEVSYGYFAHNFVSQVLVENEPLRSFILTIAWAIYIASGGMCLGLFSIYPKLRFVIQDRPPVIKQAEIVWQRDHPKALKTQRTQLMVHDCFTEQPVKGAEVYHMRGIM